MHQRRRDPSGAGELVEHATDPDGEPHARQVLEIPRDPALLPWHAERDEQDIGRRLPDARHALVVAVMCAGERACDPERRLALLKTRGSPLGDAWAGAEQEDGPCIPGKARHESIDEQPAGSASGETLAKHAGREDGAGTIGQHEVSLPGERGDIRFPLGEHDELGIRGDGEGPSPKREAPLDLGDRSGQVERVEADTQDVDPGRPRGHFLVDGDEASAEEVEVLERQARALRDAVEGVLCHIAGDAGDLREQLVHVP